MTEKILNYLNLPDQEELFQRDEQKCQIKCSTKRTFENQQVHQFIQLYENITQQSCGNELGLVEKSDLKYSNASSKKSITLLDSDNFQGRPSTERFSAVNWNFELLNFKLFILVQRLRIGCKRQIAIRKRNWTIYNLIRESARLRVRIMECIKMRTIQTNQSNLYFDQISLDFWANIWYI